MTGGNWQAGLVVALAVMAMCISGIKAVAASSGRRLVIVEEEEPEQRWF